MNHYFKSTEDLPKLSSLGSPRGKITTHTKSPSSTPYSKSSLSEGTSHSQEQIPLSPNSKRSPGRSITQSHSGSSSPSVFPTNSNKKGLPTVPRNKKQLPDIPPKPLLKISNDYLPSKDHHNSEPILPKSRPPSKSDAVYMRPIKPFIKDPSDLAFKNPINEENIPQVINQQLNETESLREGIIKDIIQAETSYIKALGNIVNIYNSLPISYSYTDNSDHINILGIAQLLLKLHQSFCNELQERLNNFSTTIKISDIFQKFVINLKLYSQYEKNLSSAFSALDLIDQNSWSQYFNEKKSTITSLLKEPLSRVTHYVAMTEKFHNQTPKGHPDDQNLYQTLQAMKNIAHHGDSLNKIKDLAKISLELGKLAPKESIMDGYLEILSVNYYDGLINPGIQISRVGRYKFILTHDCLIHVDTNPTTTSGSKIVKTKKAIQKKVLNKKNDQDEWIWPLELIWLVDGSKTGFDLIGPHKTISVMSDSKENKDLWFNAIKANIDQALKKSQYNGQSAMEITDPSINLDTRFGYCEFPNSETYCGNWTKGIFNGYGLLKSTSFSYEGCFVNGKRVGEAKLELSDGSVYIGTLEDGLPHGFGETSSSSNPPETYVGEWKNGLRHGIGDAVWNNGDRYLGEWLNGKMDGKGILRSKVCGLVYQGSFSEGKFHQQGKLKIATIGEYEGEFSLGMKSGHGTMKYVDKSSYEGYWKDDRWHGKGIHVANFITYEGDFVKGKREGQGKLTFNSGYYDGQWSDGRASEIGVFVNTNVNESRFDGEWTNGKRKGKGTSYFNKDDGAKWKGTFENNKMNGIGKLTLPNGMVIQGRWKNGVLDNKFTATDSAAVTIVVEQGKDETNAEFLSPDVLPCVVTTDWVFEV